MIGKKLLIIDADREQLGELTKHFSRADLAVFAAQDKAAGLEQARRERPDVVLVDMGGAAGAGIEVLQRIKEIDPRLCVIMMSGGAATQHAIEAMKHGAFDFMIKPLDLNQLESVIRKAFQSSRLTRAIRIVEGATPAAPEEDDADVMIGTSPEMIEIWKMVGKIAESDATVLIQGESGTGKELLARSIFNNSRRRQKPFLAVNCAALQESLLESELFGHEKGAFTDAVSRRIGRFEQCSGGALFLDEVGEMSLNNQAKLLRVLESREFERVGGNETLRADVRIIAASNRSLIRAVKEKSFRMDLFYRLRVITFFLPPLRERTEDLPLLVDFFVRKFSRENRKPVMKIAPAARKLLLAYPWPGNIRELKNTIHSAVVMSRGDTLLVDDFEALLAGGQEEHGDAPAGTSPDARAAFAPLLEVAAREEGRVYQRFIEAAEREVIRFGMERQGENEVRAAKYLGISRNTLRQRLAKYAG